jgi:hypothetical protein
MEGRQNSGFQPGGTGKGFKTSPTVFKASRKKNRSVQAALQK